MSLDEILDNHQMFTLRGGYWADEAMVKHNSEKTKEAILTDLLEIIGEDKKIIWDDYRENVQVDLAVRKRNQELRNKVRKYCE